MVHKIINSNKNIINIKIDTKKKKPKRKYTKKSNHINQPYISEVNGFISNNKPLNYDLSTNVEKEKNDLINNMIANQQQKNNILTLLNTTQQPVSSELSTFQNNDNTPKKFVTPRRMPYTSSKIENDSDSSMPTIDIEPVIMPHADLPKVRGRKVNIEGLNTDEELKLYEKNKKAREKYKKKKEEDRNLSYKKQEPIDTSGSIRYKKMLERVQNTDIFKKIPIKKGN